MPPSYINESKKDSMLSLINQVEEKIGKLASELEDNEDIETYDYQKYDKQVADLYGVLYQLRDEVIFT